MPRYLVELYLPTGRAGDLRAATARARAAAEERSGVQCLRSIFVPEDETWFLLYEAPSAAEVRRAVERASLPLARVVEAVAPR
jgi:Protein of unknown function (DUF4242)